MSKKLHSKLLSVILCLAICCATLCGSLIAAHAAAADYNGTYTISVGDDKQAVPYAATEVKAQVKFDLPAGFVGGQFTAKALQNTYTIGDEFTAIAATKKDGTALTADELETVEIVTRANESDKDIRFVIGDGVLCTSITIEYTIVIIDNPNTDSFDGYVANGTTTKYPVAIEVDGANFGVEGDYADVTFTGSDSWFHSHSSWYGTNGVVLDAEKNGKHTVVTNARCHWCVNSGGLGLPLNENYIPQVLPDYTEFDGVTTPLFPSDDTDGDAHTAWIGISGVTVSYNDDGTLDVDVHAYSQYRTGNNDKVVILVCDTEGNELYRLPAVANGTSYFAGNGFPTTEKMFTITGLSARDIDTQLLLTAVEYSAGAIEHSRTMTFCLADYCQNVVEGNSAIWVDGTTSEQIEADKDVAAALYYYGAAIDESVFDKNTSTGSSIEYVNANYDEWDGTRVEPTETDDEGNIVIRNAEQLAWIALEGAAATANKNYKVVENSVFNMKGMDGITLNSTAAQLKTAGDARVAENQYSTVQNWRSTSDSNTLAFQGNFDGNGLIAYNIYSYQFANAGLFPCVDPSTQGTITIENVTVVASYIGAYHYAGGIVGLGNASAGTGKKLVFENCVSKNNYINDMGKGSGHKRMVATIVAGVSHNGTTINNCLAINNTLSATGVVGGFFCDSSAYAALATVSNSITIGSTIAPTPNQTTINSSKIDATTYTNVYDSSNAKQGAGAVAGMGLGGNWFDTETYPELSIFHKLSKQYVDENTHKVICVLKAGDNTCDLKGLTEAHTLVVNAEGTAKVCECGYSVKVYGNIEYIAANYDEWDGTRVEPTETDDEGNIIIRNAEQLAWIAHQGAANTTNKNYKVVENSVFNMMGMQGITLDSTVSQVKAATKNSDKKWLMVSDSTGNAFKGNFDGNGLIAYNIYSAGWAHGGLFPCVKPEEASTITIKNVMVVASYMSAYHYGGGVIGLADAPATNTSVVFDSLVSKNTYVDDMGKGSGHNRTVGTIVGGLSHNGTTINNCLAINNELSSTGIIGGFFGNTSNYGSAVKVSNSIIIGSNKEPVADQVALGSKVASATYTNVHTEDVAAATLGSAWFDTTTYPELSIFHDMVTVYVDANTHQSVCQHFINGTQCTTVAPAAAHTMVDAEDGLSASCECGYSYEIKGIHAMGLPESILNRITSNSVYAEKFATNALFKSAYNEDVYGTQVQENVFDMYTTSLNLKVNPHIGFMFAFHGDYKTNRANITVTFTVDGETYTTAAVETSGALGTNWVNNAGAGRYHLYRFKELPVSKLCKDVNVTVNYNGTAYNFGSYSAAGYAINAMNAGEDYQYHVNASMALVYYSEMLAARAGA